MGSIFRLVLQSGAGAGTEYPLEKDELYLGRDQNNDLVVNDPEVSRRHARLSLEGNTYKLEDLGSTNGTFIRGQRLAGPVLLRPGEVITLGEKVVLRFEMSSSDANATVIAQRGTIPQPQKPYTPPPAAPAPAPVVPPAPAPIPAAPVYQSIPATPVYAPPPQAQPKKKNKALIVILVIVGIIVLFCVIPLIIVDVTNSYCSLFPGIMNMMFTGACP